MDRSARVATVLSHAKSLLATKGVRKAAGSHRAGKDSGCRRASMHPGSILGRKPAAVLAGTALALAGAGSASAATVGAFSSAGAPGPSGKITTALTTTKPPNGAPLSLAASHRPPGGQSQAGHAAPDEPAPLTWLQIRDKINQETFPASELHGNLPYAGRLLPLGTSGPQAWMPLSQAQLQNATTIVQQTFAKKMGIRSAVIAVATAMQESRLQNIDYGTADSVGLFQQQTDMGWGTAQQIMRPAFAADAFLDALAQYQAQDHLWARQPLWASAQAVQKSGFPFAYAQWELQAAGLVKQIAMQLMSSAH